jgi:hypothetical protein
MQDSPNGETGYRFTGPELARLAAYRDAVRAGLYGERCADTTDWDARALLTPPAEPAPLDVLTPDELERLASYRDAVAAGLLTD